MTWVGFPIAVSKLSMRVLWFESLVPLILKVHCSWTMFSVTLARSDFLTMMYSKTDLSLITSGLLHVHVSYSLKVGVMFVVLRISSRSLPLLLCVCFLFLCLSSVRYLNPLLVCWVRCCSFFNLVCSRENSLSTIPAGSFSCYPWHFLYKFSLFIIWSSINIISRSWSSLTTFVLLLILSLTVMTTPPTVLFLGLCTQDI